MSHQVFTLQELKRAWRQLKAASNQPERSNAHRLLLVYRAGLAFDSSGGRPKIQALQKKNLGAMPF